jgi:uncharacterized protein YecE (DUF72 family)
MWAYKAWQGRQLPDRLSRDEQLPAYATWCNAVEGNTTFYGLPSASTVASWAEQAPAGFRFMFKLPRTVTHERHLRQADGETRKSLELLAPLGERAETISVQLPASFGPPDLGALATFVRRFPSLDPGRHRVAVEVRHPAFFGESVARRTWRRVLADEGTDWITLDSTTLFSAPPTSDAERETWRRKPRLPVHHEALSDRPIVRIIGRDDPAATIAGWRAWIPVVTRWLGEGRVPTVFVHTPDNVDALVLARMFHDHVRAVVPELDPLPTPPEPSARRCSDLPDQSLGVKPGVR